MKRQWNIHQYGFTIVEILIVITMIAIFIAATNSFTYTPQTDTEKTNRIKNYITDQLREEVLKVSMGRMPKNNGTTSTTTIIDIGTGGIFTSYADTSGIIFSSGVFKSPYYDNDPVYSITGILWMTGTSINTSKSSGSGFINISQNGITFTGANIDTEVIILQVTVSYRNTTRKIQFDRRTGKISSDS